MKNIKAEIISNRQIAPDHMVISLKSAHLAKHSKAGQFVNIKISDNTAPLLRRPFGIYRITRDGIEILYKIIGVATRSLSTAKPGDILDIIGPLGNGFELSAVGCQLSAILVAGGHGVAPLYALAESMIAKREKPDITVFIGARTKGHILSEKEFKNLGAKVFVATDDGSKGFKGIVTELLNRKLIADSCKLKAVIFTCGPKPMLKAVAEIAGAKKIPCQVSTEEYMGCGIGLCMGCTVKTVDGNKLCCKDGPVFVSDKILWQG